MTKGEQLARGVAMLRQQRWAALATVDAAGSPGASMVAYAIDATHGRLYLHLSTLAAHTRELLAHPAIALVVSEGDDGSGDPQQLARLSLQGECTPLSVEGEDYAAARTCYLARLPDAEMRFAFDDFQLFRVHVTRLRMVGGFGQAFSYRGEELAAELVRSTAQES